MTQLAALASRDDDGVAGRPTVAWARPWILRVPPDDGAMEGGRGGTAQDDGEGDGRGRDESEKAECVQW
jgi:hypothetical protein